MTEQIGNVSIYAILLCLVSLIVFASSNLLQDWRQEPSITNISIEKASVGPNEVVNLQADVKNPNNYDVRYIWQAEAGEFLDDEGEKVIWKAPSAGGTVKIDVAIVPAESLSAINPNSIPADARERKSVRVDVRSGTLQRCF